ncbi:glycosyltransferase [Campylobacter sputorum]|uniref:glycosyltransferase family protein n=1 Tax=Campylobacter sputorum TaxID=206 RepID=UPI000B7948CB|nr:glycosyltransferase [Campylobacter sputorum]ASM36785.1 glycosyltransferase [Campylobacter sputorum bv. faecalis CCUG 20703]
MRIVHCGIFNEYDDGNFFYGLERKISHGLHQNGHFVYDFSYRDWERSLRIFGIKNSGLKNMNQKLINICKNINADVLLITKAEKIANETLLEIKKALPNIKIAMWYVDHLKEKAEFFEKFKIIDVFFYANALRLKEFSTKFKDTIFSFFPNISDPAFEVDLNLQKSNDIIYIARDYKEDNRYKFATLLDEFCKKNSLKHKIYASLGNEPIFGFDFFRAINESKIAINFNRDDDLECEKSNKLLGASDRMAQFLGCGVCVFSPMIKGFEKLYETDKEIIYFKNPNDCFDKILQILKSKEWQEISKNGREKTFKIANAARVSKFMLEVLFNISQNYEWSEFVYKNGERI